MLAHAEEEEEATVLVCGVPVGMCGTTADTAASGAMTFASGLLMLNRSARVEGGEEEDDAGAVVGAGALAAAGAGAGAGVGACACACAGVRSAAGSNERSMLPLTPLCSPSKELLEPSEPSFFTAAASSVRKKKVIDFKST